MYRIPQVKLMIVRDGSIPADKRKVTESAQVYAILKDYFSGHDREEMIAILLDAKNVITGLHTISIGSLTMSIVHPRETFKAAITSNAAAIILAHNHPSGDPTPSREDHELTKRLCQAGEILGIRVLDHLVIGDESATGRKPYTSFADEGLLTI